MNGRERKRACVKIPWCQGEWQAGKIERTVQLEFRELKKKEISIMKEGWGQAVGDLVKYVRTLFFKNMKLQLRERG